MRLFIYSGLDTPEETDVHLYLQWDGTLSPINKLTKRNKSVKLYIKGWYRYTDLQMNSLKKYIDTNQIKEIYKADESPFPLDLYMKHFKL